MMDTKTLVMQTDVTLCQRGMERSPILLELVSVKYSRAKLPDAFQVIMQEAMALKFKMWLLLLHFIDWMFPNFMNKVIHCVNDDWVWMSLKVLI